MRAPGNSAFELLNVSIIKLVSSQNKTKSFKLLTLTPISLNFSLINLKSELEESFSKSTATFNFYLITYLPSKL